MRRIAFADLPSLAGEEIGVTDWTLVDQPMIDAFAEATGDRQWIHVDVERAKREMGGTIAHGFLTLSLMATLSYEMLEIEGVRSGLNYGFDRVRFTCPVASGSRVRLRQRCESVEPIAGGFQMKSACTMEIEGSERPALVAEWIGRMYG